MVTMILGSILLIFALTLIVIGVLAWTKKLPGNSIIGLRIPEVRASQENWQAAHQIAGPLWIVSGISLVIGALIAFITTGWMWLIVAFSIIASVVFLSLGANFGARTISIVEAHEKNLSASTKETTSEVSEPATPEITAPAPQVDLAAVRRAAQESDE